MQTHDGHSLHVTAYGPVDAAVSVVLTHCWTLNESDWHFQVRDLLAEFGHDIRLVTWDLRGHGRSGPIARREATIDNLGRDLGDLIDGYAPQGRLVLAGHSIGGMTMCELAVQRPDLIERTGGAAFVSTSAGGMAGVTLGLPESVGHLTRAQIPRVLALRSRMLSRSARRSAPYLERTVMRSLVFGQPQRLSDVSLAVEGLIGTPGDSVVGFYEDIMRHERRDALKAYAGIPAVVLVGTRDRLTPPSHGRALASAISGAELRLVPGAGHMLPLERDELVSHVLAGLVRPLL